MQPLKAWPTPDSRGKLTTTEASRVTFTSGRAARLELDLVGDRQLAGHAADWLCRAEDSNLSRAYE